MEACRQAAEWRETGYPIGMSVNASASSSTPDEFIDDVREALLRSGLTRRTDD